MSPFKPSNILVLMTGSIACYKACAILSTLKQRGHQVKVAMSSSSLQFVGAATIEGLTGEAPLTQLYSPGYQMDHIHLDRWADLILVAPATAHFINRAAHGIGDDLLTTLFLAHDFKKPFLIAPAMNTKMYLHPTTQNSIQLLQSMGVEILEAASGVLACGETGVGRLLEPNLIVESVEEKLSTNVLSRTSKELNIPPTLKQKKIKILITAGGTSEPIDDVRVISNKSSGKTASIIAENLAASGFEITYLHAEQAQKPHFASYYLSFNTTGELQHLLQQELKTHFYDVVIHAAAVSDYSVESFDGKINSDAEMLNLKLKKNPKLINEIKTISPKTVLIGFKLTSGADNLMIHEKVLSLFKNAKCDYVIHNDWSNRNTSKRNFAVYQMATPNLDIILKDLQTTEELSAGLFQLLYQKKELPL